LYAIALPVTTLVLFADRFSKDALVSATILPFN